jgi:hypothetical protein
LDIPSYLFLENVLSHLVDHIEAYGYHMLDNVREKTSFFWLVQLIGIPAGFHFVKSFYIHDHAQRMRQQAQGAFLFALMFLLMGEPVGCLMSMMMVVRNLVFQYKEVYPWAKHKIWPVVFLAWGLLVGAFNFQDIYSILPVMAGMLGTVGAWKGLEQFQKLAGKWSNWFWFLFGFFTYSPTVMATRGLMLTVVNDAQRRTK